MTRRKTTSPTEPDTSSPDAAADIDAQVAYWRTLDAEASQPSGAQGIDDLRALDVNTLQATVDALRALGIDARHVNTLQAVVDALRALNTDTSLPGASPANPLPWSQQPAHVPPGTVIFVVPEGHHYDEAGRLWPFLPHPRVVPLLEPFLRQVHAILRAEDDALVLSDKERPEWLELVSYLRVLFDGGKLRDLAAARKAARNWLKGKGKQMSRSTLYDGVDRYCAGWWT